MARDCEAKYIQVSFGHLLVHGKKTTSIFNPYPPCQLHQAGTEMLIAWDLLKGTDEGVLRFFEDGFDRTADPCLEGRIQTLLGLQV